MLLCWVFLLLHAATPTLIGRVSDFSGRPIPHADITLTASDGQTIDTTSSSRGSFRFEIEGGFTLRIRHAGFRTVESSKVSLPKDGVYQIDVPMNPGDPDLVDPVDLQIQEPSDNETRDDPNASAGLPKSDRLFGLTGGINVSGIREGAGQQWVSTTGNVFTSSSMTSVVTGGSDFSIDSGATTAADDALPAGEDVFHGNIHYFLRNNDVNARNFFDDSTSPAPPFRYNFFGGDTGGRIGSDTHVYMQYWGLRIAQSITRLATVPDPAWLTGDFSGVAETLLDPQTTLQFPNNRIPTQSFNPQGLAIARLYPAPNLRVASGPNYRAVAQVDTVADSVGFRVDRRMSSSDEAFAEYQFNRDNTNDPFNLLSGITNLPFFGIRDALQTHELRLNDTHVFSPRLVDQIRFSMSYLRQPRTTLDSSALPAILMTGLSDIGQAANLPQRRSSQSFELLNDVALQKAKSSSRFGASIRYFPFHGSMDLYNRGQFEFTGGIFSGDEFANLLLGYPTNALQILGDTTRDFRSWIAGGYAQHDWRPVPRLFINAGIRYDYQSPFREVHGLVANFNPSTGAMETSPPSLYQADRNNFSPRLSLAFQPSRAIVVRTGYGIFYDTLVVGDSLYLLGLNPPFVQFNIKNNGPTVPEFTIDTAFNGAADTIPPSVFSTSRQLANPYVQQWSLSVERPLWRDVVIEVGYRGQKGTRLRRELDLNQPPAGPEGSLDDRRPFPNFRNIFQFETSASSIAHSADLHLSRRLIGGVSFDFDYRFSRLIDDATLISVLPQNSHDLRDERGLADFQIKHHAAFQATVNLPGMSLFGMRILKGWQLHGIGVVQSGTPLSAVLGSDYAGTGNPIVNRPDLVGNPNLSHPTPSMFFNTSAFRPPPSSQPASGQFGNSGRNVIIGPGLSNLDVAASRIFRVSDLARVQFRADAYNVFNHPNFVAPPSMQNFEDSPGFGHLSVARSPRILQFGLKFLW